MVGIEWRAFSTVVVWTKLANVGLCRCNEDVGAIFVDKGSVEGCRADP